jgi:parvulin-like peptidyl-prolyl isomerase
MSIESAPIEPESRAGGAFFQASRINPARSMLLFGIGSLAGLAIAGYSLFTAQGTATRIVPPEDLALVNQRPILRSDFITQLENETGTTFDQATRADKLKVLDEMVREELLVQRGLELDFAETDQDARNALVSAVNQQVVAEVTTSQPTEAQLQEYYAQHKEKYATEGTLTARDLVLPKVTGVAVEQAMGKARDAASALRSDMPIEQVMQRYGLTEATQYGEDFYFAARIHLGDALFEKVAMLRAGAVSDPFVSADGIHVVKLLANTPPVPLTFERSRQQVLTDYKTAAQTRLVEATLKFLRDRSKILIASDYADDYKP